MKIQVHDAEIFWPKIKNVKEKGQKGLHWKQNVKPALGLVLYKNKSGETRKEEAWSYLCAFGLSNQKTHFP